MHDDLYGAGGSNEKVCDYDTNATVLYELLESSSWERARSRCRSHPDEVRTWIVRKDKSLQIRWKLLPLHAAIIFQSPNFLVSALLEKYPAAASRKDDQGMLPLHLAFRHKQEDEDLLELLLLHYPKAVMTKDKRDRVPLEHGRESKFSAKLLKIYADAVVAASRQSGKDLDSPAAATAKTDGMTTVMTAGERAMLEAEHSEAMENMKREYESQIRRLRGNSGSQLKHLEDDTASKVTMLRADYEAQIRNLKELHDRRLAAMHDHHQAGIRQIEMEREKERRAVTEQHAKEMNELRDLLTSQVGRDKELSDSLEKEIAHLQVALQERRTEAQMHTAEYHQAASENKVLRDLLKTVYKQQVSFEELLMRQQEDLESARQVRQELVQTLLRQDDTNAKHSATGQQLVGMAETLRRQLNHAMGQDGKQYALKNISSSPSSRRDRVQRDRARGNNHTTTIKNKTHATTTHPTRVHHYHLDREGSYPTEKRNQEENYGEVRILADEISAMTENSQF